MLKFIQKFAPTLLVCLALMFGSAAPSMAAGNFAVIDVERIQKNSLAFRTIQDQMRILAEQLKAISAQNDKAFSDQEAELQRQRAILGAEAFNQKRRQFEQQVVDYRRRMQDNQRLMQAAGNKAIQQFQAELARLIDALVQEQRYDIVFHSKTLVFSSNAIDITQVILDRLNATVTQVTVEQPVFR